MANLIFKYGAMGSSKTANALMVHYNYYERGKRPILLKPKVENRDGELVIRSRIGLEEKCETVEAFLTQMESENKDRQVPFDVVIVDEAQFLTVEQIDALSKIVDEWDKDVICYGLRTDFTGHLFDGAKRLMELADDIEQISTICWCGRKAQFNARIYNGKVIKTGEQLMMGGNECYVPLCRKHYTMEKIAP